MAKIFTGWPQIDHFMSNSKSEFYVVSDPDIALFGSPHGNILHVIASLLRAFPEKQIIGPTMRVDDVPPHSAFHELIGVDRKGYETEMWHDQLESFKFQKTMNDTLLKILERYELDKPILMSDKLDIIWDKSTKVNKDET